jgi:hypothetical protein
VTCGIGCFTGEFLAIVAGITALFIIWIFGTFDMETDFPPLSDPQLWAATLELAVVGALAMGYRL